MTPNSVGRVGDRRSPLQRASCSSRCPFAPGDPPTLTHQANTGVAPTNKKRCTVSESKAGTFLGHTKPRCRPMAFLRLLRKPPLPSYRRDATCRGDRRSPGGCKATSPDKQIKAAPVWAMTPNSVGRVGDRRSPLQRASCSSRCPFAPGDPPTLTHQANTGVAPTNKKRCTVSESKAGTFLGHTRPPLPSYRLSSAVTQTPVAVLSQGVPPVGATGGRPARVQSHLPRQTD